MKILKYLLIIISFTSLVTINTSAQLGRVLNKVKNDLVNKTIGNKSDEKNAVGKEPNCACDNAIAAFSFEKGYNVVMSEISVKIKNGDILLFAKDTQKYFIKRANSDPEGPFEEDDPEVKKFDEVETLTPQNGAGYALAYPGIIFPEGEKYIIQFGSKKYGPYAVIQSFVVNQSKTKFVATVTGDVMFTESDQKMMEGAKEKSQQEQMALAMKMQQKMQQRMANGGALDIQQKIVSNVEGIPETLMYNATLSSSIKSDDIVWVGFDKISDLQGNMLMQIDRTKMNIADDNFWLSSDNKTWATYSYGHLQFSDGRDCTDVFSPYIASEDGKSVLVYMYFSPKNNAIMKCPISF